MLNSMIELSDRINRIIKLPNNWFDAVHGFFAGFFIDKYLFFAKHPNLNKEAATDAWLQVLELFQNNL